MKNTSTTLALAFGMALAALPAWGQQQTGGIPEARNNAYIMASKYANQGFFIQPAKSDICGQGATLKFMFSVNTNVDYMFVLAGDRRVQDIDVYVYSETGQQLVADTRASAGKFAGVQWTSDFNGTVQVYVHVARASGLASWTALVGRRGMADSKEGGAAPAQLPNAGPVETGTPVTN